MSKTIDERVVSMKFDNSQFEKGAKETMSTLDKLEKSLNLKGAAKGIQEVGKTINSLTFDPLANQLEALKAKFDWKNIIGITVLTNVINDVVNKFKGMVEQVTIAPIKQGFEEYELKMGAVQTMIASTGESLETVNGYLEQLNLYADKTIYSFSDMTQNIGKFTNNGVKLEDAVGAIQGISNAAAVAGANSNEASRAMYNFSQALSQGSVKLIDWKSIQNANMATVDFKQNLIDTAVALGTVKKKGDQYVTTTTDLSGKVSEAFDANKMFNESLSHSWMTTEVLVQTLRNYSTDVREMSEEELDAYKAKLKSIGYTEEQIKKIVELSTKAFDAATQVKTFSQLMDTLAEAVGSGWSQTFEIIFGDFEQAKELWTGVNNVLSDVIGKTSDARNNMLKEVMGGFREFDGYKTLLESFETTISNIQLIVTAVKNAFSEIFPKDMTVKTKGVAGAFKEIRGGARILVEAVEDLNKAVKSLTPSKETLDKITRTFKGIFAVLDMGKKILSSIFKAVKPDTSLLVDAGSNILDITSQIGDALVNFDKNFDPEKSFGKILNGVKIVIEELQFLFYGLTNFSNELEMWGTDIGGIFAAVFNTLMTPVEFVINTIGRLLGKDELALDEFKDRILGPLYDIRNGVVVFLRNFKPFENLNFKMPDFSGIKEFADSIIRSLNPLEAVWKIMKAIGEGLLNLFTSVWNALGPIAKSLGNAIKSFFDIIAEYFQSATLNDILNLIQSGVLILLGNQLTGLVKDFRGLATGGLNLKALTDPLKNFGETITKIGKMKPEDIGNSIKKMFESFMGGKVEDGSVLRNMAESILMLSGALFILALIPTDKLMSAVAGITTLFVELTKSIEVLNKSIGGTKKSLAISASVAIISFSMLEMAAALQVLSAMSWERVAKGLTNFGVSMAVIVTSFKSIKGDELTKTAAAIWIVSNAMIQMGTALQIMSAMSWERVAKGLVNFATSMGIMFLAFKMMPNDSLIKTAGAIWIVSNAMTQMGIALQLMSAMSWERVAKSLIVFGGSMVILVKAFNSMSPEALIQTAGAIWIVSNAMIQMGLAMQIMGAMKGEAVAKSLIAFAGAMIIMVKAFNDIDNDDLIKTAASMWIFGQAMIGIGTALQIMGAMSFGSVLKSLTAFGGTVGILIVALNNINAIDAVKIAGSLLLISVSMTALGSAMLLLGSIGIDKVLISLGALAGVLTVLGVAAAVLGPLIPAIALLGAGLAAAGAGMLLFGTGLAAMAAALMLVSSIGTVAIGNILATLEMLVVGGLKILQHSAAALAELIVSLLDDVLVLIKGIIPPLVETFLLLVDEVLESLATHGPEILKNVVTIISELFTQLNAYLPTFITQVADFIIAIIDGIAENLPRIIVSIMNLLGALLQGAIDALNTLDRDTLVNGILAVGLMASLMASLAGMALLAVPAMAGVTAFGAVITKLGLVLAAIGLLAQIPGLDWLINEGGDLLNSIGTAIGKFIGGIGEGLSKSLPEIGKNLSSFMEEAETFIKIAKTIDRSVYDGIANLIDAMLLVIGGSFATRITAFLTGDANFEKFGNKLRSFGQSIKSFANEIDGVDASQVSGCADATLALVKMAQQIPNEGGLVSLITGDNSLGKFAEELAAFAPSFGAFAREVKDIDVDQVKGAADATICLAEMARSIPNEGGLVSLITGDNSLQKFGLELLSYGYSLKGFSDSTKGLRVKAIKDAADATLKLTEMAANIPNTGGLVSLISGDNSLGDFGLELSKYGVNLKKFSNAVRGIMSEDFTGTIDSTERLINMVTKIPNTGGLVTIITGDNSLVDFGAELAKFGPKLAKFSESIKSVNTSKVKVAADATETLVNMTKDLPTTGGIASIVTGKARLSKFGKELEKFGSSLSIFASDTEGIDYDNIKGAVKATEELVTLDIPKSGGIVSIFKGKVNLGEFGEQLGAFAPGLKQFAADTSEGIDVTKVENAASAASALLGLQMPTSGGVKEWFTGQKVSLGAFGSEIAAFATGLVAFNQAISGESFDVNQVTLAANCANSLIGIANNIPPTKGIKGWLSGKTTLSEFAKSLKEFATEMFGEDSILDKIKGITKDDEDNAVRVGTVISSLVSNLSDVKPTTLGKLGDAMKNLGNGLKKFSESVASEGFDINRVSSAISQLSAVSKLANDLKTLGDTDFSNVIYLLGQLGTEELGALATAFSETMYAAKNSLKAITDSVSSFVYDFGINKGTIQTHCTNITSAIELMQTKVSSAFGVMATDLSILISKYNTAFKREDFEKLGNNVTLGINDGLERDLDKIEGSSSRLAELIVKTIEDRLEINSPSKVGAGIGRYFDLGIANGMEDGIGSIEESGYSAGDAAINSMKDALRSINDIAEDELNTEPVIKPVLDLSNIEGSNRLGTIFTAGIGLSSSYRDAQGIIRSKDINTGTTTTGIDPKQMNELLNETKLMREEIGNFSTELSNMKVIMDSGALVGQIGPGMDIYLGQRSVQMGRSI